jgi:hypothetical protein
VVQKKHKIRETPGGTTVLCCEKPMMHAVIRTRSLNRVVWASSCRTDEIWRMVGRLDSLGSINEKKESGGVSLPGLLCIKRFRNCQHVCES